MKIKQILYITTFVTFLAACEQIIEIDVPPHQPKLVINAINHPDSVFKFDISASVGVEYNEQNHPLIKNAHIKIYEGGVLVDEITELTGEHYDSSIKAIGGKTYTIEVSAAGYQTVTSTENIPQQIIMENIEIDSLNPVNRFGSTYYPIYITFTDPAESENYYQILAFSYVTNKYQGMNGIDILRENIVPVTIISDDPIIEQESSLDYDGLDFSDLGFSGKQFRLKILVSESFLKFNGNSQFGGEKSKDVLQLKSLSSSYYKYLRGRNLQQENDGNPFAEPVPVFSNITNGYGIFGSYSQDQYVEIRP